MTMKKTLDTDGEVIDLNSRMPKEAAEDFAERMTRMALSFPTLRSAAGVDPWNPGALDQWALTSTSVTTGSLRAARFVLSVYPM